MAQTIDFTSNFWGHALHGSTMYAVTDCGSWLSRLYDKIMNIRRYTVMVHTSDGPRPGDKILYKAARGTIEAEIYDYKWCRDPQDMYTLFIKVTDRETTEAGE